MEIPRFVEFLNEKVERRSDSYPDSFTRPMVVTQVAISAMAKAISKAHSVGDPRVALYAKEMARRNRIINNSELAKKAIEILRKENRIIFQMADLGRNK